MGLMGKLRDLLTRSGNAPENAGPAIVDTPPSSGRARPQDRSTEDQPRADRGQSIRSAEPENRSVD